MKTVAIKLLAASAVAITASATALAVERGFGPWPAGQFSMHMLEHWDADGDGAVTLEEFLSGTDHRFEAADADNDDVVTEDEIAELVEKRGERRAVRFLARLDADGDGKLSLEEATQLAVERAKRRFDRADADGDGFITAQEAGKLGSRRAGFHSPRFAGRMMERFDTDHDFRLTRAEADKHRQMLFGRFDADDDGKVTAEEFQAGLKTFGPRHRGWRGGFGR